MSWQEPIHSLRSQDIRTYHSVSLRMNYNSELTGNLSPVVSHFQRIMANEAHKIQRTGYGHRLPSNLSTSHLWFRAVTMDLPATFMETTRFGFLRISRPDTRIVRRYLFFNGFKILTATIAALAEYMVLHGNMLDPRLLLKVHKNLVSLRMPRWLDKLKSSKSTSVSKTIINNVEMFSGMRTGSCREYV